jgi:uncharacterized protein YprB with RNaseH-like and TPR domain
VSEDLRRRLRDLGVVRGVERLPDVSERPRIAIEDVVAGHFHTTSHGRCFIVASDYDLSYVHGTVSLAEFLDASPQAAEWVGGDPLLAEIDLRRMCFIDTETTGLSAGTGTMAFVVGLGFFAGEQFCVRQYFLRDPGDEPAMIEALADVLPTFAGMASFNGRAFDVPILENRFILARVPPPTVGVPHLDLLQPARRIWRYELSSCRLGVLEEEILGIEREQDDVPGGVIPLLYRDYLRTGDARDMRRVLYHNAVDVLSLVTLAARMCQTFDGPSLPEGLAAAEYYGIGRWYASEGRVSEAEQAYRAAVAGRLEPALRMRALWALGGLLKRTGRRAEACAYWQQLAIEAGAQSDAHVIGHEELAKYFEWDIKDHLRAANWTRAALAVAEAWACGPKRDATVVGLRHRLSRLERKMEAARCGNAGPADCDA